MRQSDVYRLLEGVNASADSFYGSQGRVDANFDDRNEAVVDRMLKLTASYGERIASEEGKTAEEVMVENVGKVDPKKHLEAGVAELMQLNIIQCLGTMLDTVVF